MMLLTVVYVPTSKQCQLLSTQAANLAEKLQSGTVFRKQVGKADDQFDCFTFADPLALVCVACA
jgi:hypothetical protein